MKHLLLYLFFLIAGTYSVYAQDAVTTTEQLIADIYEQYAAESEDEIDYDTFYEELMFFSRNPINLNRTTREELERLPFLSDSQVENILFYVYRFGRIQTIYELQLIDGLDMTDIRRMLPFVFIGEGGEPDKKVYWKDLLRYGKNELSFRLDRGLETREGYRLLSDGDNTSDQNAANYMGNAIYHSLKYRYHYKDRILLGFTAEKDAGEQFWGSLHKGYDFYSVYAQINDVGKVKTLVVGNYQANFGLGLVLRQEFRSGKSSYVLNVYPRSSGVKKYASTDENNFFRGAGSTVRLGKLDITAFYSNKMIDGDTLNGSFSSQYKTGLHRTLTELKDRHTILQQVWGANSTFTMLNFQLGFTAVHTLLNVPLKPDKSGYNYYFFSGNKQTTAGFHYRLRWGKLNLYGETAMSDNRFLATINGFSYSPVSQVSLVTLYRYYAPEYDTFYASSFSETSRINNERGFYLGAEIRPYRKWKISSYLDSYRFPWLKYGIDAPSIGSGYLLQTDYAAQSNVSMLWRFKYEDKQTNLSGTGAVMPVVVPIRKASCRYQLTYSFGNFSFKNLLEGNLVRRAQAKWTYGFTGLQDVSYTFPAMPLKIDFRYQVFDAVEYENRFYTFERDILYAFSFPMYYGLGSRYYLNLCYELSASLSVWFKLAQTVYGDDRESLSTGNEEIIGNRKTDVRLMLKWNF